MDASQALPPGATVSNYAIERTLGKGGFGITYLAQHRVTRRRVAIKELFPQGFASRQPDGSIRFSEDRADLVKWAIGKFQENTTILAGLDHPGIVRIQDFFNANNTGYQVMDLVEGEDLRTVLKARGRLTLSEIGAYLDPVVDALVFVHAQKLVHRDIAPDNIMIRPDGAPILIDFGGVKNLGDQITQPFTSAGGHSTVAFGKPGYSAPEMYEEGNTVTSAADIYSLAAVVYAALSGSAPVDVSLRSIAIAKRARDPLLKLLDEPPPDVPRDRLERLLRALDINPANRPRTIEELREIWRPVRTVGNPAATAQKTDATAVPATPPPPRRLGLIAAGIAALGLAAATFGLARQEIDTLRSEVRRDLTSRPTPLNPTPDPALLQQMGELAKSIKALDVRIAEVSSRVAANVATAVPSTSVVLPGARQIFVSGSSDGTIIRWDAATGKKIGAPLKGHTNSINAVAFAPDGRSFISASNDKTLIRWDAITGQRIGQPLADDSAIYTVAFAPDGKSFVSGAFDKTLLRWNAATGQRIGQPLTGHTGLVLAAVFAPDGKIFVSCASDKTLIRWDAATGQRIGQPLTGHTGTIFAIAFAPDGKSFVSGSRDNTLIRWDAATGRQIGEPLQGHKYSVTAIAFAPDGSSFVSGAADKTLIRWDATTGQRIGEPMKGHTDTVYSIAFAPDGRSLVSASDDKTLIRWDTDTGKQIGEPLKGHTLAVNSIAFSPRPIVVTDAQ